MTAAAASFNLRDLAMEPRRQLTLRAARRHTSFVRVIRVLLLLGMAGVVSLVGGYVVVGMVNARPLVAESSQDGTVRMVNPRFTGRDSAGEPYVITAEAAVRRADEEAITRLESPRMEFIGEPGRPGSLVTAENGVYDRDAETLDLFGEVRFRSDSGYLFQTAHATAYVAEGRVMGDQPITGEGPLGEVDARSFEIWDSGARIVFKSNVVAQIYQEPTIAPGLRDAVATNMSRPAEDMIR